MSCDVMRFGVIDVMSRGSVMWLTVGHACGS